MNNELETENEINEEEPGRLFVGGLSWETSEEKLRQYFGEFGIVIDAVIMKHTESGQSRGFGFVTFDDPECVEKVLATRNHLLDGRAIDPKRCSSKSSLKMKKNTQFPKVFLGGLPFNVTETDLRTIFSRFGEVMDVIIMYDHEKNKCRGFGFLSFEKDEEINKCVAEHYIYINGKKVEIKRAEPKDGKTAVSSQWPVLPNAADPSQNQSFQNYSRWAPTSNPGYGYGPLPNNTVPYGGWSNFTPQWGQGYGTPGYNPYGTPQPSFENWNWNVQPPPGSVAPPPTTAPPVGVHSVDGVPSVTPSATVSRDQYHQSSNQVPAAHQIPAPPLVKPEYTNCGGYIGYSDSAYNAGNVRAYPVGPNNATSVDSFDAGPGPQRNNLGQQGYHPYRRI